VIFTGVNLISGFFSSRDGLPASDQTCIQNTIQAAMCLQVNNCLDIERNCLASPKFVGLLSLLMVKGEGSRMTKPMVRLQILVAGKNWMKELYLSN